jgi:hypothetical protein
MLKKLYLLFIISFASVTQAFSQTFFTGTIIESGTRTKLTNVFINNLSNGKTALTNDAGHFKLPAAVNDIISFSFPGYFTDTIVLLHLRPVKRFMRVKGILLNAAEIKAEAFDLRKEYPEAYTRGNFLQIPSTGGVKISLTKLLGKKGIRARRLKRMLEKEVKERRIDALFNEKVVAAVLPLKGNDLKDFVFMYRPTLSFLKKSSASDLTIYINDSYKKFLLIPLQQRIPKLQ